MSAAWALSQPALGSQQPRLPLRRPGPLEGGWPPLPHSTHSTQLALRGLGVQASQDPSELLPPAPGDLSPVCPANAPPRRTPRGGRTHLTDTDRHPQSPPPSHLLHRLSPGATVPVPQRCTQGHRPFTPGRAPSHRRGHMPSRRLQAAWQDAALPATAGGDSVSRTPFIRKFKHEYFSTANSGRGTLSPVHGF